VDFSASKTFKKPEVDVAERSKRSSPQVVLTYSCVTRLPNDVRPMTWDPNAIRLSDNQALEYNSSGRSNHVCYGPLKPSAVERLCYAPSSGQRTPVFRLRTELGIKWFWNQYQWAFGLENAA
jgi:hypothetical protein